MLLLLALLISCAAATAACSDSSGPDDGSNNGGTDGDLRLTVEVVAEGLSNPLYLTTPPGDARLFVVEQAGRVLIIEDGQPLGTPFLDISDRVSSGGERGLLSIAFHPEYAANGFFFVSYTDDAGDTQIERYSVSADPDAADPASGTSILSVDQPFSNHNGGLIVFGPDGMLYVGLGDGGSAGDPQGNGQDAGTLLGSLLRIDVDGGDPYAIPADNPFVGVADASGEIWAYGLRNPWRFAFDPAAGTLYIADVGQNMWEEVNAVGADEGGLNFGWNIMEGAHCFAEDQCDMTGLELPVLEYGHSDGCSVTGGYVYRGADIPELQGHYLYSDFCSGFLRSFRLAGRAATERTTWDVGDLGNVMSFGEDSRGELYVLSQNGRVYRIREEG